MKTICVIPARYKSSRLPGKPLADICGRPMVWWTYHQASQAEGLDEVYVATEDERVEDACKKYGMNVVMTSASHDTPTSRLYEVSKKIDANRYVFVSGDEPLIDTEAIETVVTASINDDCFVTNAMTRIKAAPEVIDYSNIKVVVNTAGQLLYTTRSPLPYPKGGLDFDYMKFVGIAVFTKEALQIYHDSPRTKLERIEECDLMRFVEKRLPVKMVEVSCGSLSVDTPKDLETVKSIIERRLHQDENMCSEGNVMPVGGVIQTNFVIQIHNIIAAPEKEVA